MMVPFYPHQRRIQCLVARLDRLSVQCVPEIASALIFNESEIGYKPITILLDYGAQRSFIKKKLPEGLKLRTKGSASFR